MSGVSLGLCEVGLNNQPVQVFHQSMPPETLHRARAGSFLVKPSLQVEGRGAASVRSPVRIGRADLERECLALTDHGALHLEAGRIPLFAGNSLSKPKP